MDEPGGRVNDEVELAELFADIARQIQHQTTAEETWQAIVDLSVQSLGFHHCGISLVRPNNRIDTPAASDELPVRVDALQYETDQGPCLSAIREEETYRTGDLAAESRWPRFAERIVSETGVHSMLSLRLFTDGDSLGALNFYSSQVDAFDDRAQSLGGVLAAHAAVAMSAAQDEGKVAQLEHALDSSRVTSTAVGILMVQTGSSRVGALHLLTDASQRSNVSLRVIAERIVAGQEHHGRRPSPRLPTR